MPTFAVTVDGVSSREQHDALHATVQATLLRHLAGVDVAAGDTVRVVLECTCQGQAGSGNSGRAGGTGTDRGKGPVPLRLEHRTVALPADQLGRFRFDLTGVDLPDETLAAIERDLQLAVLPQLTGLDFGPGRTGVLVPHGARAGGLTGFRYGPVDDDVLRGQDLLGGDGAS